MDVRAATALAGQVKNVAEFCHANEISWQTFYEFRRRFADPRTTWYTTGQGLDLKDNNPSPTA